MTVCWHAWRTGDLYVPHRCQQPPGHPGPHICNCNATDNRETPMTPHPARPAYPDGYRPTRTVAELMEETDAAARADEREQVAAELADLDALTADVFGPDVPLRDRVATLVADWQDTSNMIAGGHVDTFSAGDIDLRQRDRRGIA